MAALEVARAAQAITLPHARRPASGGVARSRLCEWTSVVALAIASLCTHFTSQPSSPSAHPCPHPSPQARSQLHSLTSENGSLRQRLSHASAAMSELPAARAEAAAARAQAEQLALHDDALTAHAEQLRRHLAVAVRHAGAQQPQGGESQYRGEDTMWPAQAGPHQPPGGEAQYRGEEAMWPAKASKAVGGQHTQASRSGLGYLDRPVFAAGGYTVGLGASLD